jgi:hypothetical protein
MSHSGLEPANLPACSAESQPTALPRMLLQLSSCQCVRALRNGGTAELHYIRTVCATNLDFTVLKTSARLPVTNFRILSRIILIWFWSPSETTFYYIENNQSGYMFRPCVGHHQASTMYWSCQYINDILPNRIPCGLHIYNEIRLLDVT